jgi:hypothetical protein
MEEREKEEQEKKKKNGHERQVESGALEDNILGERVEDIEAYARERHQRCCFWLWNGHC